MRKQTARKIASLCFDGMEGCDEPYFSVLSAVYAISMSGRIPHYAGEDIRPELIETSTEVSRDDDAYQHWVCEQIARMTADAKPDDETGRTINRIVTHPDEFYEKVIEEMDRIERERAGEDR